eukprot:1452781-Prymnesium_polylepis.2
MVDSHAVGLRSWVPITAQSHHRPSRGVHDYGLEEVGWRWTWVGGGLDVGWRQAHCARGTAQSHRRPRVTRSSTSGMPTIRSEHRNQAIGPSGNQAIRPSGHQAIRPSGNQAIKPSGHQGVEPTIRSDHSALAAPNMAVPATATKPSSRVLITGQQVGVTYHRPAAACPLWRGWSRR